MANLRASLLLSKGTSGPARLCLLFGLLFQHILAAQNVGIGTTTPTEKLEVGGNIKVSNGGDIKLENSDITGLNTLEGLSGLLLRASANNGSLLQLDVAGNLVLANNLNNPSILGVHALRGTSNGLHLQGDAFSSSDLFVHPNGNIGINNTDPTEKLEVKGNIKVSTGGEIRLQNSHIKGLNTLEGVDGLFLRPASGNSGLVSLDLDGNLTLSNGPGTPSIFGVHALRGTENGLHLQGDANSTSDLFIHPNGRVGIGNVPNPTHLLQVNGGLRVESEVSVGGGGHFSVDAFGVPGGRFTILADGHAGFRHAQSNIALNVQSQAGDDLILNVEGASFIPVLQVRNDAQVRVTGSFFVINGAKNFLTDHPLDPANKTLQHACVESNEVLNIYSGTVLLDGQGKATIELPDYCEALNKDFRYQLTCVGGFAPVFVSQKVTNNRFEIAGGSPGLEVSWQVTGVRNDAWFRDHPYRDVVEKTGREKGLYYYPAGFGMPAELDLTKQDEAAAKK